ncbi:MAG: macro domain-containing protein [Coriobacteriia bacterium]|nr:macro domain-containing protein [Coriobacteriia bacterium]
MPILLARGDITRVVADAIVNAANAELRPGGGVCGAIHAAAGPRLAQASAEYRREHGSLLPGQTAITPGFELPARFVIHALGPVWHGGTTGEATALASAYRNSIELADTHELTSVAFPSISTGVFGYPVELAAPVAIGAAAEALEGARHVRDVTFVLFDQATYVAYERALRERDG